MMWFISRSLGFLLESIVMSIILHMVGPMENLMENTIAQAEQIAGETQTQKSVAQEVEESFRQVNEVSGNLLRISQKTSKSK